MENTRQEKQTSPNASKLSSARFTLIEGIHADLKDVPAPKMTSHPDRLPTAQQRICEAFFYSANQFADRTALVTRDRTFTYQTISTLALSVGSYLQTHACFNPGDRVAMLLDNGPEYMAALYGISAAAGIAIPLPPNIERHRLERIVDSCDVQLILTSQKTSRRLQPSNDNLETLDLSKPPVKIPSLVTDSCVDSDPAMILFTSGSSGDPKGVMLSDQNLIANAKSILHYLPITRDDRALALLPFYHAFGNSVLQTHLLSGATLIIDGNMTFPNTVVEAIRDHRATSFSGVPEAYHSLMTMSELAETQLPELRYMCVAGGALKPESVESITKCIAPADFYVMYGQTEATARLAYLPPGQSLTHSHSIGKPIDGVSLQIFDDQGNEVSTGTTGELCAQGPNVMLGYWQDEPGTRQVIRDGWLRTGDLASQDEEGNFYIKSRKNDLIKVQGYRIHPQEIEDAVAPFFPEIRFIVVPFEQGSLTRLALFGVAQTDQPNLVDEIRRVCKRELPRHKIPYLVELLNQVPLNNSMKLDRAALKQRAQQSAVETSGTSDPVTTNKLSA